MLRRVLSLLLRSADRRVVDLKGEMRKGRLKVRRHPRTFVAKRREHKDSLRWTASGDKLRNINVFELPLREFCRRYVSCDQFSV